MTTSPDSYSSVSGSRLRTPSQPAPADQPAWNRQRGSEMPYRRYRPFHEIVEPVSLPDRTWPDKISTVAGGRAAGSRRRPAGARSTCGTATRP